MLQSLTPSYLFVIFPLKITFPLKKPINFLNFKKVCNEIYAVSLNYLKWTTYHSRQSSRVRVICVRWKIQLLKIFWQICKRMSNVTTATPRKTSITNCIGSSIILSPPTRSDLFFSEKWGCGSQFQIATRMNCCRGFLAPASTKHLAI